MKKLILVLIFFCSFLGSFAQSNSVLWFRTTEFAWMYMNEYGSWSGWSDWEKSNMKVKIDLNRDQVIIYSSEIQIYNVIEQVEAPYDPKGQQVKFRIIDQEEDYGYLRLRVENSGNCQIYIDFADLRWVYNVVKVQ